MSSLVCIFLLTAFLCTWPWAVCSTGTSAIGARPYYIRPQPFRIISEPTDKAVHVLLLNNTIMKCEVNIQPIVSGWWPHIYWRHNGSTVNSSWPIGTSIDTNFWNFSVLHTFLPGSYQCVVDDGSFILVSRVAQITLLSNYPDLNPPLWHSVEACPGGMLHLPCQPLTADYQVQVIWRKNGIVMRDSPQYTILQPKGPGDLVIYNFTEQDVGNYSCSTLYKQTITEYSVTQSNDSCTSRSDVHVIASREYIQQGEDLFLVCLTRFANARFSWLLEGVPQKEANASVLHVVNSSETSLGKYTCRASMENGLPVASASMIVKRFENVSLLAQSSEQWLSYDETGSVDHSLRLTCHATGSPPLVTTWFHNGRAIPSNDTAITINSGANAAQVVGMYQCFVKNLHSEATQAFRVKLYRKPNPPGIVIQEVISSSFLTELRLTWQPDEDMLEGRKAAQYLRVISSSSSSSSSLGQRLASQVSETTHFLQQHGNYQFYIEAFTTGSVSGSQWFLFSSKGNVSKLFTCCNPIVAGNGSIRSFFCEPEYIGKNDTVRCAFYWTLPSNYTKVLSSTIDLYCPNGIKRQQIVEFVSGTSVNTSIANIPCNADCKASVSATAWDIPKSNAITYHDAVNQTIKSASIAPCLPAEIRDVSRSSIGQNGWNCTGIDVKLSVYIPEQRCGDPQGCTVHYDNNSSQQLRLEELPNDSVHTIHVQLPPEFQWKNTSLSLVYWNLGGNSPLSNTVQVPGITSDNIKECVNYDCVQYTKQIVCSLDFLKLRASQKDLHFNDVTFTVLDCKKLRDLRECSLENGCDIIGSENVSISSNEKAYFTQMNTCYSHTYCIVAAVSMETGELAHFNTTSHCTENCAEDGQSESCLSPSLSTTVIPTTTDKGSQNTSTIMYSLMGGLIFLVIILVMIIVAIVCYCCGRKKQSNDMLESLRSLSSQSTHGLSNPAESRRESMHNVDHYNLQSTVHPDDVTQVCPINDFDSQADLSRVGGWVEDQQRRASETTESEDSDCADESKPLLTPASDTTTSPRPNHPDGSSQIKDVFSSDNSNTHYVDRCFTSNTSNVMQQLQPSQPPRAQQTYVELQMCGTMAQSSVRMPESSTSFAEASAQSPSSPSSPYVSPKLVNEDGKRRFRLFGLGSEDQAMEQPGPLVPAPGQISPKGQYVQPSVPPPVSPYIKGYVPHSAAAVEGAHVHSILQDVGGQVHTTKPDISEALETPTEPFSAWTPPSLLVYNSQNLTDGQQ